MLLVSADGREVLTYDSTQEKLQPNLGKEIVFAPVCQNILSFWYQISTFKFKAPLSSEDCMKNIQDAYQPPVLRWSEP